MSSKEIKEYIKENIHVILYYFCEIKNGQIQIDTIPEYILEEIKEFILGDSIEEQVNLINRINLLKKDQLHMNIVGKNSSILSEKDRTSAEKEAIKAICAPIAPLLLKKEFINRYEFLLENVNPILEYYMEFNDGKVSYNIPECILKEFEAFLLSDTEVDESPLKLSIDRIKNSPSFQEIITENELMSAEEKYNRQLYFLPSIYKIVRNYILGQNDNKVNKEKKLLALDEYFRFKKRMSSSGIIKSGAVPTEEDYGDFALRMTYKDEPYKSHSNSLNEGFFINFIANKKNHHEINDSIFTEEEIAEYKKKSKLRKRNFPQ